MQISYVTHAGGFDIAQGYGYAGVNIVNSLQKLGHTTPLNLDTAPIALNFTQPYYYQFHPGQYLIGYTPWESSGLHDGWVEAMNNCDEVWTTSDLCLKWFKDAGVTKPLHVYEHGIEHIWTPFRRRQKEVLRFLHIGEPAPRKSGQMAFDAFAELFGNNPKYELTIKANGYSTIRGKLISGEICNPLEQYKNVFINKKLLTTQEMVYLYQSHHVLIYPSYGEGFGFIPLQGMATGMPTIFNPTWAPYRRFSVGLDIEDRWIDTKWPNVHPGKVLEPSYESLKQQMQKVADDFESYSEKAFALAPQIHDEYDWISVTKKAFDHIEKKFETG